MKKTRIKYLTIAFVTASFFLITNCDEKTGKSGKVNSLLANLALTGVNETSSTVENIGIAQTRALVSPITGATRSNFVKSEIQAANSFITDASIRSAKYADMKVSSFDFYRATAHLYYKDLQSGIIAVPSLWKNTSGTKTWIQGDLHTLNIGFFDNDSGTVKLDVNDFDESYVAPFYWDLIRLVGSIFLQRNQVGFNFSLTEARASADSFLQEYQDTLTAVNGNSSETTMELVSSNTEKSRS